MTLMIQVCLLRKILNWRSRLGLMSPGIGLHQHDGREDDCGDRRHDFTQLGASRPVGAGSITYRPMHGREEPDRQHADDLAERRHAVEPMCGETCSVRMLFMPNQPMNVSGTRISGQTKPAFWNQVSEPAGIFPIRVPEEVWRVIESPPRAPKSAKVITSGTRICMVVTPALPSPAFNPSASPCMRFG